MCYTECSAILVLPATENIGRQREDTASHSTREVNAVPAKAFEYRGKIGAILPKRTVFLW